MSYHEGSNWQAKKEDLQKPLYTSKTETLKVKIINCTVNNLWYKNMVGQTIKVFDYDEMFYVGAPGFDGTFLKADCAPTHIPESSQQTAALQSEIDRLREEHKLMCAKLQQIQALIEIKGSYDLLEPVQELINKIQSK